MALGSSRRNFIAVGAAAAALPLPVFASPDKKVEGKYSDPNHPKGYRLVTVTDSGDLKIEGNDSSTTGVQWTLVGKMNGEDLVIDFSPKGGPKDLPGKFVGDGITFPDGNKWPQLK